MAADCLGGFFKPFLFVRTQENVYRAESESIGASVSELFTEYQRELAGYGEMSIEEAVHLCEEEVQAANDAGWWDLTTLVRQEFVLPQLKDYAEYPAYLNQVQQNAETLGKYSIFSSEDSFTGKNIKLTAKDYAKILGTEPVPGNYYAVSSLLTYHMADVLILLVMIVIGILMLSDRKLGLWGVVHLAGGGRGKLAGKRIFIYTGSCLLLSLILYGSSFLLSLSFSVFFLHSFRFQKYSSSFFYIGGNCRNRVWILCAASCSEHF